jgi:hypothetical protein
MAEEEVIDDIETTTVDAEEPAPETTDESDAESEPATKPEEDESNQKLTAMEKKLARQSYELREAKRRETQMMSLLKEHKQPDTAPKIEDFETLDEYIDARYAYNEKKKGQESIGVDPTGTETSFTRARDDLIFEGSGKYEDFAEKVTSDTTHITPAMANAIFEMDDMDMQVEIAYSLANNPREAMRIARLSPMRQVAEIGKLEAKLSAPKPAKKPSSAPSPMKPVGGRKTTDDEIGDQEDFETFMKKRNKQLGR